jgi:hypothetical protein
MIGWSFEQKNRVVSLPELFDKRGKEGGWPAFLCASTTGMNGYALFVILPSWWFSKFEGECEGHLDML